MHVMSRLVRACSFLYAIGHILNSYAFAGISGVVVPGVRDLNDTHEFVVDHNALGAVLTGSLCFVHINVVDQFPKQRCSQGLHLHEFADGMNELILIGLHRVHVIDTATQL